MKKTATDKASWGLDGYLMAVVMDAVRMILEAF